MNIEQLKQNLTDGSYDSALSKLYGTDPDVLNQQRARYLQAAETFSRLYPERSEVSVFSAPGRTEIGGNHTDHQHGCVLAASVNLDVIAIIASSGWCDSVTVCRISAGLCGIAGSFRTFRRKGNFCRFDSWHCFQIPGDGSHNRRI